MPNASINFGDRERAALKDLRKEVKGLVEHAALRERLDRVSALLDVVQI